MKVELSNTVENIVSKGKFKQFILKSQCLQKSSVAEASEGVCMWERVDSTFALLLTEYF